MKVIGHMIVAVLTAVYTSAWWVLHAAETVSLTSRAICVVLCLVGTVAIFVLTVSYLINHWDEIWGIKTK
jgi:hypothetical protein